MEEKKESDQTSVPKVYIQKNGPILIKGIFRLRESSGKITEGEHEISICRCGNSSSMPFCDNTCKRTGVPD